MNDPVPRKEEIKLEVVDWWRFQEGTNDFFDDARFGIPIKRNGISSRDTVLKTTNPRELIFRSGGRTRMSYSARNYRHPEAYGARRR